ncbi:MAG: hypothetical protein ACRCZM_09900, partial [Bacteroidales bacterium]
MSFKPTLNRGAILLILTLCCSLGVGYAALVSLPEISSFVSPENVDTTSNRTTYPVAKTIPKGSKEVGKKGVVDLDNPENLKSVIEFDAETNS